MSYLPFFPLFAASGVFLRLLGAAFVPWSRHWNEQVLRLPWIGWAILLAILQVIHLFAPINRTTAIALVSSCGVVVAIGVAFACVLDQSGHSRTFAREIDG